MRRDDTKLSSLASIDLFHTITGTVTSLLCGCVVVCLLCVLFLFCFCLGLFLVLLLLLVLCASFLVL